MFGWCSGGPPRRRLVPILFPLPISVVVSFLIRRLLARSAQILFQCAPVPSVLSADRRVGRQSRRRRRLVSRRRLGHRPRRLQLADARLDVRGGCQSPPVGRLATCACGPSPAFWGVLKALAPSELQVCVPRPPDVYLSAWMCDRERGGGRGGREGERCAWMCDHARLSALSA